MKVATIFAADLDPNSGGWTGYTLRQVLAIGALTVPDFAPSHMRVAVEAASSGSPSLVISEAVVGHQAVSGDAFDYDGSDDRALSFAPLGPGEVGSSGWVPFAWDRVRGLVIAVFTGAAAADYMKQTDHPGAAGYYKEGSDAGTPDGTGYAPETNAVTGILQVDVAYFPGAATFGGG